MTPLPESWGDNPGEGGQPGCNPPSPSGFSPPVPRFPPSPSPSMQHPTLHTSPMLHKTLWGEIWRLKSWERFSPSVLHKSGEGCGKESAREKQGSSTQGLCTECLSRFFFRACRTDAGILAVLQGGSVGYEGKSASRLCAKPQAFPACCCPRGGERISIVRCALSPLKEVVARTPVDGSCVTHLVKQIEQQTSPQDIGKPVLRKCSTQSIKDNVKEKGHQR